VYANGISVSPNGQSVWVASPTGRKLHVFERKEDDGLRARDTIETPLMCDNINFEASTGAVYCAGHQNALQFLAHVKDENSISASMVIKVTNNTNQDAFYGKKFNVDVVLADSGKLISGATAVVPSKKHKKMLVSGLFGNGILVCPFK
jgi:sugar lactone lactonase YvrE